MSDHSLELKGSLFPLSVLHCQDLSADTLRTLLSRKLEQAPGFFYQAPVVLNLSDCQQVPDFKAIKQLFTELQLVLVGVCGASAELKKQAQQSGLAVLQLGRDAPKSTPRQAETKTASVSPQVSDSKLVEQTVRSGQQVYAKGADLIVRGSVGAGAEVIADGNIHIYGTLRGKAIAGAAGDTSKRIFCHNLQAELVSIAGNFWLSENLQGPFWGKATCVRSENEQLTLTELV